MNNPCSARSQRRPDGFSVAASPSRSFNLTRAAPVETVTRTGGELDPKTRTMLTEVDFDNSKGQFVAGSFVNVSLLIPATSYLEVPSNALVSRDKKTLVGVLGADNRVALRPITVASTDGKVLRVAAGLNEGEKVVLNLPTTVVDGGKVNPAPLPGAPAPAPAPPQTAKGAVSAPPGKQP